MAFKLRPHHDLVAIKRRFASAETLEISVTAIRHAALLDFGLDDIVDVVQALEASEFTGSATAFNPKNSKVWHDSYRTLFEGLALYLKFAGETLVDVSLVSFKEAT